MDEDKSENESKNDSEDKSQQDNSQNKSGKGLLKYALLALKKAIVFALDKQAPEITDFLSKTGRFISKNGIFIMLGYDYGYRPAESVIYLDSGFNNTPLAQREPSVSYFNDASIPRLAEAEIDFALRDLVETVKIYYPTDSREKKAKAEVRILS